MLGCCSDQSQLCERCATDYFNCLRGTAANRGERWARVVAARYPQIRGVPWPVTEKARRMAIKRVADLTSDPKLAELAESLVHLTSTRRRVAMEAETVGGPIDVAVITKGDGFIWLKRKHYFRPELDRHFFLKMLNGG